MYVLKERLLTRLSANCDQGKQRNSITYLYNNRQQTHASRFGIDGVTNSSVTYYELLSTFVVQCISIG